MTWREGKLNSCKGQKAYNQVLKNAGKKFNPFRFHHHPPCHAREKWGKTGSRRQDNITIGIYSCD